MMTAVAFLLGTGVGWSAASYAIAKRKAKADELRYILALTIPHCPEEDAIRRAGC